MIRTLFAASTLALALIAGAGATTGARAQSETAPAEQAQFSDSHLALARDVVTSSGLSRSFEAVIPQMQEALLRQYGRNPALLDDVTEVIQELRPEMDLQRRAMVNRAARVIAARLSEEDLAQIAAFFDTEAGKRYVEVQPAILDGLISEMQVWSRELNEYLQIRVQAEMVERREAQAQQGGAQTQQ